MHAIILAAGRGSRLKKLTESTPKCLLKLGGKTLLQWQTEALLANNVSKITIVRGYKRHLLKDPFYNYLDNPRWADTNMVYTLFCASKLLEQFPCLISYSDIVYHPSIISTLKQSSGNICITYDKCWKSLWKERFSDPMQDAETFFSSKGKLVSIGEKVSSLQNLEGQYMGLLKISPQGWKNMKEVFTFFSEDKQKTLDMTSFLQELLKEVISICTVPIEGRWCEVDQQEDLALYQKKISIPSWSHNWRVL